MCDKCQSLPFVARHKGGTVHARGRVNEDGLPVGLWEWFRRDGSVKRRGRFDHGDPVGDWVTFDRNGTKQKVTRKR